MKEDGQIVTFEMRIQAVDRPTTRRRWNGDAFASEEAHKALDRAVDAARESLKGDGFVLVRSGYGVTARLIESEACSVRGANE